MAPHRSRVLAAAAVCALAGVCTTPRAAAGTLPPVADTARPGSPGLLNALTDVPGLRVGQVQSTRPPYATGTTVVHAPGGMVAAVAARGAAPGSWETGLIGAAGPAPAAQAVVLTGGGPYGLDVAGGVLRWLEQHGTAVPVAPGAAIQDLGDGGAPPAHPTGVWGYQAIGTAARGPVRQGSAGAGTGAVAGGLKGGVGTASVRLEDGIVVGALVVVDTAGSPIDPRDCTLPGAARGVGGEFAGLRRPDPARCAAYRAGRRNRTGSAAIAVIATNAGLRHPAATRMAVAAQDGVERAIAPAPGHRDGSTVFALATGAGPRLDAGPRAERTLARIYRAGADTLARAITHALLAADSGPTAPSYCGVFPAACRDLRRAPAAAAPEAAVDRPVTPAVRPDRGEGARRPIGALPVAHRGRPCVRHRPGAHSGRPVPPPHDGGPRWLERLVEWLTDHSGLRGHHALTGRPRPAPHPCRPDGPSPGRVSPLTAGAR